MARVKRAPTEDQCVWQRCTREGALIYFGIDICWTHWLAAGKAADKRGCETRKIVYHHVSKAAQQAMRRCHAQIERRKGN